MSRTIRFPLVKNVPNVGLAEPSLVLTLLSGVPTLKQGGADIYKATLPWKTVKRQTESPFTCFAIEFTASAATVIGNGTFAEQIGLYGGIYDAAGGLAQRYLIGVLGIARGGGAPQIPISTNDLAPQLVGYAQMAGDLSVYDSLSVGGVVNDITPGGGILITVKARPIRAREYLG